MIAARNEAPVQVNVPRSLALPDTISEPMYAKEVILWTLRRFCEQGQVTEVLAFGATTDDNPLSHTLSGFFDNAEKLAEEVAAIRSAHGIYFIPNPVKPALLMQSPNRLVGVTNGQRTQDDEILQRHWFLINLDAVRPSGVPATSAEQKAAWHLGVQIRNYLGQQEWPSPIQAFSGNGFHLRYRINAPRGDGGLVKRCLESLANRFDGAKVKVDRTVHNPARMCRLYGSRACEGKATADRPHRMSRISFSPKEVLIVPRHALEALAAETGEPTDKSLNPTSGQKATATTPHSSQIAGSESATGALPMVQVPGGKIQVRGTASTIGTLLAATGRYFRHGGALTRMRRNDQGIPTLEIVNLSSSVSSKRCASQLNRKKEVLCWNVRS